MELTDIKTAPLHTLLKHADQITASFYHKNS